MSNEALCPANISDAFTNNETSTLKSISNENIEEMVNIGITESNIMEEFVNGKSVFVENDGDNEITKQSVKLWEINGVSYNKSEIQSICEPVSYMDLNKLLIQHVFEL